MKTELKYFILGSLANIVAIVLVLGVIYIAPKVKRLFKSDNEYHEEYKSNNKIDQYIVYGDFKYYDQQPNENSKKIVCSAFNDIKYIRYQYFITNNNELYEYSENQMYSETNENCRKITDKKIKTLLYSGEVIDENKKFYYISNDNGKLTLKEKTDYTSSDKMVKKMDLSDPVYINTLDSDSTNDKYRLSFLVLKDDGILYKTTMDYYYMSDSVKQVKEEKYLEFKGEKIKQFQLSNQTSENDYVLTDKALYVAKLKVPECKTFADVICQYDLEKEDYYTQKFDSILVFRNAYNGEKEGSIQYINKDGYTIFIEKYLNKQEQ